jgi:hypothetical protein
MRAARLSLQPTRERARWAKGAGDDRRISLVDTGLASRNERNASAETAASDRAERRVYPVNAFGRKGSGREGAGAKALVVQNFGLFCRLEFASNFVSI